MCGLYTITTIGIRVKATGKTEMPFKSVNEKRAGKKGGRTSGLNQGMGFGTANTSDPQQSHRS